MESHQKATFSILNQDLLAITASWNENNRLW